MTEGSYGQEDEKRRSLFANTDGRAHNALFRFVPAQVIPKSDTGADNSKVRSYVVRIRPYLLGKGERRDGEVENALEGNRIPGEVIPRQCATPWPQVRDMVSD